MHRIALAVVAAAVVLAGGAASSGRATSCVQANLVFYTSDSARLATELAKTPSACADYYVSVSPTATGSPRPAPLATMHAAGPHVHAMAEFQPKQWTAYAAANGWYAAGVEFRRQMGVAGFDVSRGDTWEIDEAGEPSGDALAVGVITGANGSRAAFRDLVRGLYAGSGTPAAGVVFAANPPQLAADLSAYTSDLRGWLSDAPFWQDMNSCVLAWGQETYADARAWGVPGSSLDRRAAYLNDYFLHADRLARGGDGATDAARRFFAHAYTPIGNAAYKQTVGFGYADIGLPGMLAFVSSQTYALRQSTPARFGFAVVPKSGAATATEIVSIEDRIAGSIAASDGGASGSCNAGCDFNVPGAQFTEAWKAFANTLEGDDVSVDIGPSVNVRFASVTARGATEAVAVSPGEPPAHLRSLGGGTGYAIDTTASYSGPVTVCLAYDAAAFDGYAPELYEDGTALTTTAAAGRACAQAPALGTFALFAADPTPPVVVSHVDGPEGLDGWYVGDVTVSWDVSDPQSAVVTDGCDPVTITADTAGTTLECVATSDGGTTRSIVVVRRDATPPAVSCSATPSTLWPPNGKLVPVVVTLTPTDETSGVAGYELSSLESSEGDIAFDSTGFVLGAPDLSGRLRAARDGDGPGRTYTLTYTVTDHAGNEATCSTGVVVPHDER